MLGHVGPNELSVRPVARFPNGPVQLDDGLHWNIDGLYGHVLDGLAAAAHEDPEICSIGVDSWAVDYALIGGGRMLAAPFHYRDDRTVPAIERVHALVPPEELYAANGLQFLPFNTIYQLAAEIDLKGADSFLLVPDLINFWLTGRQAVEQTNASTTGLLDITTGGWDDSLIERLGLPRRIFPDLVAPGTTIGVPRPELRLPGTVTAVGSHDTASAVVAVPATRPRPAALVASDPAVRLAPPAHLVPVRPLAVPAERASAASRSADSFADRVRVGPVVRLRVARRAKPAASAH